ncbi:MAG: hypothetical protein OHK0046_11180 [Anaerolineae bacterium]
MILGVVRAAAVIIAAIMGLLLVAVSIGLNTPTGPQIAYVSKYEGATWDIYLMDVDRQLAYNATRPFMQGRALPVRNRFPAWSANGAYLAFVSEYRQRQGMDVLVMNPAFPSIQALTNSRYDETMPVWSPAGVERIAYNAFNGRDWDIYVRRTEEDTLWMVQEGRGDGLFLDGPADDMLPRWSPNGTALAFISNREGGISRTRDLYIINANGRSLIPLTRGMVVDEYIEWSPSGSHIAFVSQREGNREVYVVNVITGGTLNLSRDPGNDYMPQWSPDGTRLAFVSNRDGDEEIYVITVEDASLQQITQNTVYDYAPQWSPDGTMLLYVSEPAFTSELYIVDAAGRHPRRLTYNLVDDWNPVWRPE